jgi:hypothetical protein
MTGARAARVDAADDVADAAFHRDFLRAVLAPDTSTLRGLDAAVAAIVAHRGFAVYRNTVASACVDALLAAHPSVAAAIGEAWLREAAAVFMRRHPPATAVLADYGDGLAAFLAGFEPAAEWPWLAGVATLDRMWREAHRAADAPAADAARLAELPAAALGDLVLRPHPAARWIAFADAPVVSIWRANRDPDPAIDAAPVTLEALGWRGEAVLVARPRDRVLAVPLPVAAPVFLDACAGGETLGAAAASLQRHDPAIDLADLLSRLLAAGAFTDAAPPAPAGTRSDRDAHAFRHDEAPR